jgi:hypothetical protein
MPQRPFEDRGTLRTDGSVPQDQAYQSAEAQFSTAQPPTTLATRVKSVFTKFRQKDQLRTDAQEDPSQAVRDSYQDS